MIATIKTFLKKRRLRKQIAQASFNCASIESASAEEFEELNLGKAYDKEVKELYRLRNQLNQLTVNA